MHSNDMSEDTARSAGHVGNFLSQHYWVACKESEFENMLQDRAIDVMSIFPAV